MVAPAQQPHRLAGRHDLLLVMLLLATTVTADSAVTGRVRDAVSGEALPGASIGIIERHWATVADEQGAFRIPEGPFPVLLRISRVGYSTFEVLVDSSHVDIGLSPAPLQMDETTIDGRDPAYDIMRRVAARRETWKDLLTSWRTEVYTRQTLHAGTRLIAFREGASEIFQQQDHGTREQFVARRASPNVSDSLGIFPISAYLFDLYSDEVTILGQSFPGPTTARATDSYRFQLSGRDGDLLHISVYPRRDRPSFSGSLVVRDGDFVLVEASLRPNLRLHHPVFASVSGFSFLIEQQFARVEPGVWLPTMARLEIEGETGVASRLDRLREPRPTRGVLRGEARYVRSEVDAPSVPYAFLTDETFVQGPQSRTWQRLLDRHLPQLQTAETEPIGLHFPTLPSLSTYPQTILFRLHQNLPTTTVATPIAHDPLARQTMIGDEAIKALIAGTTSIVVDSLISPGGPVPLQGKFTSEAWVNRVDGLHFAMRWRGDALRRNRMGVYLKAGYDTGSSKPTYAIGLRRAWGQQNGMYAGLLYSAQTQTRYRSTHYTTASNSYAYLLNQDDYFDFYRNEELRAEWGLLLGDSGSMEAGFNSERHSSLQKKTDWNFCDIQRQGGRLDAWLCEGSDPYRENPAIRPGRLNSIDWRLNSRISDRLARIQLEAEVTTSLLGSDFSFARISGLAEWRWLREDHLTILPASVTYRVQAGGAIGDLPPQRHGSLDGGLVVVAPFGTFRSLWDRPYEGHQYAALFHEWRWGDGILRPFSPLTRPVRWLAGAVFGKHPHWGMGWAAHGAHGRTWLPTLEEARTSRGWHHEAGLSLATMDAINVDYTWRLDRADRRVSISYVHSF